MITSGRLSASIEDSGGHDICIHVLDELCVISCERETISGRVCARESTS